MRVEPSIFREYDIRGVAGRDLTPEVATLIGRSIGTYLGRQKRRRIALGRDCRLSSDSLHDGLVRNQYGASLGGRLIRDRAFFFFNWEDRKDRSATAQTRTVPSESFKQGIIKVALTNGQTVSLTPAPTPIISASSPPSSKVCRSRWSSTAAMERPA